MTLAEVIDTLQTWIRNADDEYDHEEMGRVAGLKEALHEIKRIDVCEVGTKMSLPECEDAISRAEVLKKAEYTETEEGWSGYTVSVEDIKDLPSVQPKHKTGSWKKDIDNSRRWDRVRFYCSECGSWQTYGETDYCPLCGARMIKPQESEGKNDN